MPSDRSLAYWQRAKWGEGLVLVAGAPFFLFPERFFLITALFLLLLAGLWIAPLFIIRSPLIPTTPYNASFILFCLAVCAAILVTADPELTLSKATGLILGLGVWRFLILSIRQQSQVRWAVAGYLLFGLGLIAVGLFNADWLQKTTSQVPILGALFSQHVTASPVGAWNMGIHPNQVAGTITLVLPLLIALFVESFGANLQQKGRRWAILLAAFFCGVALLLTQSRSGWVGVLGGLLVLLVLWGLTMKPSRKRHVVRISAGVVITSALLLLIGLGPQRLQQMWLDPPRETVVGSFSTLSFRQVLWPVAVQTASDFPFTGIGLGAFRQAARRLYPVPIAAEYDFAHAHNIFLQVTVDLGIPGLIAYSAILLVCIGAAWQIAKGTRLFRAYSSGLLASLAAFHIFGLADALALGSKPAVLLWALFGLLAAMVRLR